MAVSGRERLLMLRLVLVFDIVLTVKSNGSPAGGIAEEPGSVARVLHAACVEEELVEGLTIGFTTDARRGRAFINVPTTSISGERRSYRHPPHLEWVGIRSSVPHKFSMRSRGIYECGRDGSLQLSFGLQKHRVGCLGCTEHD